MLKSVNNNDLGYLFDQAKDLQRIEIMLRFTKMEETRVKVLLKNMSPISHILIDKNIFSYSLFKALLKKGLDPNERDPSNNDTILHLLFKKQNSLTTEKLYHLTKLFLINGYV